eukprot:scaffold48382_cov77-Phaeocystis_antarctica.AAC.1
MTFCDCSAGASSMRPSKVRVRCVVVFFLCPLRRPPRPAARTPPRAARGPPRASPSARACPARRRRHAAARRAAPAAHRRGWCRLRGAGRCRSSARLAWRLHPPVQRHPGRAQAKIQVGVRLRLRRRRRRRVSCRKRDLQQHLDDFLVPLAGGVEERCGAGLRARVGRRAGVEQDRTGGGVPRAGCTVQG